MYIQNKAKHAVMFSDGTDIVNLKVGYPVKYDKIDEIAKTNPAIAEMLKKNVIVKLDEKQANEASKELDDKIAAKLSKHKTA